MQALSQVAYVELHVTNPSSRGGGPLPDAVLEYQRQIEGEIDKCEKSKDVGEISRTASSWEEKGRGWWDRKKHNEWLHRGMKDREERKDESEWPRWADELDWFLAVLDRLREGGLLAATRGKARITVFSYWDDYLGGKPYTKDDN